MRMIRRARALGWRLCPASFTLVDPRRHPDTEPDPDRPHKPGDPGPGRPNPINPTPEEPPPSDPKPEPTKPEPSQPELAA